MGYEEDSLGVVLKDVTPASAGCNYFNNGFGIDYTKDNKGDVWDPPVSNIMSYSHFTCQTDFSRQQIGQMWFFIENDFPFEHESQFSNVYASVCNAGTTYQFLNAPAGVGPLTWRAVPSGLIDPGTTTGTGPTAFVKAANSSSQGWATIEWFSDLSNCSFFSTSLPVWVGRPNLVDPVISGPASTFCGSIANYEYTGEISGRRNPKWEVSLQFQNLSTPSLQVSLDPTHNGNGYITFVAYNNCGEDTFCIPVAVSGSACGPGYVNFPNPYNCAEDDGSGFGGFAMMYPNPSNGEVLIGQDPQLLQVIGSQVIAKGVTTEMGKDVSPMNETIVITVTNQSQEIIHQESCNKEVLTFNWRRGTYYVQIVKGDLVQIERLLVE